MILDIGAQSRSVPDFTISSQGRCGCAPLKSSISISSLITLPTELKLCRLIIDVSAHSRSVPDSAISSRRRSEGALLEIFKSTQPIELLYDSSD